MAAAWDDFGDDVIRRRYPDGGWRACLPLLPGRNENAIQKRARALGIKRNPGYRKGVPKRSDEDPGWPLALQVDSDKHLVWQVMDRAVPAVNDGPLIGRIAA